MSKHISDSYDTKILELHSQGLKKTEICRKLKLSYDQLKLRAKVLNLEFGKPVDFSIYLNEIIALRNQKKSLREIAKIYNTNHVAISAMLSKHDQNTKMFRHQFNHNFFDEINNEAAAYFLGMMLSDGFVQEGRIGLNLTDRDVIEKFKTAVNYDGNIRVLPGTKAHHKEKYEINLYSVYTQRVLEKYNIVPNKSLILKFPNKELIPNDMIRHVIRGIFDGDGGFKYDSNRKSWNIVVTGTRDINEKIQEYSGVAGHFNFIGGEKNSDTWHWAIQKQLDVIKFSEWIYNKCSIYMDRKYKIMERCLADLKSRKLYLEKEND